MRDVRKRSTEGTYLVVLIGTIQRHECRNDDLRPVFKEFPILGPESTPAARAELASRAPPERCARGKRDRGTGLARQRNPVGQKDGQRNTPRTWRERRSEPGNTGRRIRRTKTDEGHAGTVA